MLRLQMFAAPTSVPGLTGQLQTLIVKNTGNLPPAHVQEIALYADENANGVFDGEQTLGGTPDDVLIATGGYSSVQQAWIFSSLETKDPARSVITSLTKNYFVAVRISTDALSPSNFGVELPNQSFVILTATSAVGVAKNNFPVTTTQAVISRQPATVRVAGDDIAAWGAPTTATTTLPLGQYPTVDQGVARAGMLRLRIWTDAFTGVVGRVRVTHTGTGNDGDLASVRLYLDSVGGDATQGDGDFQPAIDKEITSNAVPPTFSTSTPRSILMPLANASIDGIVNPSTRTFFVIYEVAAAATPGLTHGAQVLSGNVQLFDGIAAPFANITSTQVTVTATADQAALTDVNRVTPNNFSVAPFLTQGDVDQPVGRLTMQTLSGSAIWTGLMLDHWIPAAINGGNAIHGKAADVANVRIWEDTNANGLFDSGVDQSAMVNPAAVRSFPVSDLAVAVSSTATSLQVADILRYFPGDDVFPQAPGRLILNDGDTDPSLREVVVYTGVNTAGNAFTGLLRGQEGTTARDYPVGTKVSGQARIPLIGPLGGVQLNTAAKDYFVTMSLDPLATVHPSANLGFTVPATSYFQIQAPKVMNPVNVGLPPGGRSASLIPTTNEFPDAVFISATDTVTTADFLQQDATDQAVVTFTARVSASDALWRFLLVTATGTATAGGTLTSDVTRVSVWHDANSTGFLDPGDVRIGTGTFGNTGPALVAKVDFGANVQKLVTTARATLLGQSQRYFVTYDIATDAQPADINGNARTLGLRLAQGAFVQANFAVDDPNVNALSLPNFFDNASPLPFQSKLRPIVPSPRVMTLTSEPVFSGPSGTLPVPRLAQNITTTGLSDAAWVVTTTSGLPPTGFLLVDSEVVEYGSIVPGALLSVTRGRLGTLAAVHSSGTVAGPMAAQGEQNLAFLKLTAVASGFNVRWATAAFTRMTAGLNGQDADVSTLRIWKDNGDGLFNRDPVSGLNIADSVLGAASFGAPSPVGVAALPLSDPALGSPGYALVTTTPSVYFVTMSVSPSARFSHDSLVPPNEVTGVQIQNPGDVQLGPTGAGHTAAFANPVQSAVLPIIPTVNTVLATPVDVAPLTVQQNTKSVGLLTLTMQTNRNTSLWQGMRAIRTGTGADSDVETIKVWKDVNSNGLFDSQDSTQTAPGVFPNLISFGNESFSSATVNIIFRTPVVVTTAAAQYFVSYDVSQFATVGGSQGLLIPDTSYMTVNVPNLVTFSTAPIRTKDVIVEKAPAKVTLGIADAAADHALTSGVAQAQRDVTVLRLSLNTDISLASWKSLRIQKNGTSSDPNSPFGRNTDVKFVRVYKDIDQNDQLSSLDQNISEVTTQLSAALAPATNPPFQLPIVSTQGFPAAGKILVNNAELMVYASTGSAAGQPYLNVTARAQVLGLSATPRLPYAAGTEVRKVDLFDQTNNLNSQIVLELAQPQPVSPTPQVYFLVYDVGDAAVINNSVGVQLLDRFWVGIPTPDEIQPVIRTGIAKANNQAGTNSQNFPYQSSNINIRPIFLTVTGNSVAPLASTPTATGVPLLQVTLRANLNKADLGALALTQTGTGASATVLDRGFGDISRLRVWLDNGNGLYNPFEDVQLGESTAFSRAGFSGAYVIKSTVPLSHLGNPFLTVTTVPMTVFISADIGVTDGSGESTIGHLAGIMLEQFADIRDVNGNPLAIAAAAGNVMPVTSNLMQIAQAVVTGPTTLKLVALHSSGYPGIVSTDQLGRPLRDAAGRPLIDTSKWISVGGQPLLDVDGDGVADNFDCVGRGMRTCVSLGGNGIPSMDLDGDGIFDLDLNGDSIPDQITLTGTYLVDNSGGSVFVSQGFAPIAWTRDASSMEAALPVVPGVTGYYQIGAASDYNKNGVGSNPHPDLSGGWITVGPTVDAARALGLRPAAAVVSVGKVSNLSLTVPKLTRITSRIGLTDTVMEVESTSGFFEQGVVYVGSEMMLVRRQSATSFTISQRGVGVGGSTPQEHLPGEVLSDQAALYMVQITSSPTSTTPIVPPKPMFMFRLDVQIPSAPGAPKLVPPAGTAFQIDWTPSVHPISDLNSYELQERKDNDPVWRTIAVIPAKKGKFINNLFQQSANAAYRVGSPSNDNPGESPRQAGFYSYRVRSFNNAGQASAWSVDSEAIGTGQIASIISQVSNFPNPVDTRKAGPAGRTAITYVLNADAEVKITLYDLLGYVVREFSISSGQQGGKAGPNFVMWDGTNSMGNKVAKGGYIARIEVKSPSGTSVAIRKIGIIH